MTWKGGGGWSRADDVLAQIVEELLDAHYRGVRVRIITDDDQASKQSFHVGDSNSHGPQGRNNYLNRLHAVGVPIRTDTSRHHMHNKFCIIDNKILLTGSFNWTAGAVLRNQENVVVVGAGAGVAASHLIPLYKLEFLRLWHTFGKRVLSAHNPRTVSYRRPPFSSTPGHRFDALFFPDVDMTCRRVLEGGTCHNGNCKYFHGDSSLRRLIGYLDSARRSMDVCVLTITCNEVRHARIWGEKGGGGGGGCSQGGGAVLLVSCTCRSQALFYAPTSAASLFASFPTTSKPSARGVIS